jgi:hypothetical protein
VTIQVAQEREQFEQRRADAQTDEELDGENSSDQTNHPSPIRDGDETVEKDMKSAIIIDDPPQTQLDDDDDEHHGETILETQEDTVIY